MWMHAENWVSLAFLLLFTLAIKPLYKRGVTLLDEKIKDIQKEIEEAVLLEKDAKALLKENEEHFLKAKEEAKILLKKTRQETKVLRAEMLKDLKHAINYQEELLQHKLAQAQKQIETQLRDTLINIAFKSTKSILTKYNTLKYQEKAFDFSKLQDVLKQTSKKMGPFHEKLFE